MGNDNVPALHTKRTLVRLAKLTDLSLVMRYWSKNGHRYRPPLPRELLTEDFWTERTQLALEDFEADKAYKFYVFSLDESEIWGTVSLYKVRPHPHHDCTLGYGIGGVYEGKGIMYEATVAALDWVFAEKGLRRVEASHALSNQRSGRLLDRLGFETVKLISPEEAEKGRRVMEIRPPLSRLSSFQ